MASTKKRFFLAGLSTLLAVCGWATYFWLSPQLWSKPTPVSKPPAIRPFFTASKAGLFFTGRSTGTFYQAPTLKTAVRFAVSGTMIRATVRQHFYNPSSRWLEGIYVFPLPEHSGVDRLRMQIGDRFVEGLIQEKAEAKKAYDQAKKQGKRASLVSSARDNLFTTRVANVGPEEEIIIEFQYGDTVRYADHKYSLRFPMVVAPRYVPGKAIVNEEGELGTTEVPDAGEILSPIHDPQLGPINPVSLSIDLNPGFEADLIQSRYHPITIQSGSGHQRFITLDEGAVPADRDFVLEWQPPAAVGPVPHLIAEQVGADTYLHGTVFPPGPAYTTTTFRLRDLTLVVDISGSMAGTSIAQVKKALHTLLTRLTPEDRFNLITFASSTTPLFPEVRPATESNIDIAKRFTTKLEADGGTDLLPALNLALSGKEDELRFRQVMILTDGAIGYEEEVLRTIHQRLGSQRLFMVGIGSAPNSFVMREAATLGRGTFTYIGKLEETTQEMLTLLKKLEHPAVTDMNLEWPPHLVADELFNKPEMYPFRIPDLYHDDAVSFDVKFRNLDVVQLTGTLRITGQHGAMPWEREIPLHNITPASGVAKLWAREKISQLMNDARRGKLTQDKAKDEIVGIALAHQLVTRHTSLVAIDRLGARRPGSQLITHQLETNFPSGWNFEPLKKESTQVPWLVQRQGPLPDQVMPAVPASTLVALSLPQTATAARLHLILGFMGFCLWCAAYYLKRQYGREPDEVE